MNNLINDKEMNYIIEELTQFTRSTFDLVKPLIVRNREVNLNVCFYPNCKELAYGATISNNIEIYLAVTIHTQLSYYEIYGIDAFINNCKNNLLFTIIHELYHAEQFLIHKMYNNVSNYNIQIENQVDYMACIFIQQYTKYLEDNLNVKIDLNSICSKLYGYLIYHNCSSYTRFNAIKYYSDLLDFVFPSTARLPRNLIEDKLVNDDQSTIYLNYNGSKYIIKDKGIINEDFYKFDNIRLDKFIFYNKVGVLHLDDEINRYFFVDVYYDKNLNIVTIELIIKLPEAPLLKRRFGKFIL